MAKPDPRTDADDVDRVDDAVDPTTGDAPADDGAQVSEAESLDDGDSTGYGDAPADGAIEARDLDDESAEADPRSAATTGRRSTSTETTKGDKGKERAGNASRSGNPARKASADDERGPRASKVSRTPAKPTRLGNRWAAPAMAISAGIGLLWIVVFYVTQDRIDIPFYSDLGSWNLVIGMGFIVAAFGFAMKWE